jgi:hypothetical protein
MPNPKGNPTTLVKYTQKWKHGNTRTIRVPVALADRVLDYAHKIDEESVTQVNSNGNSHTAVTNRPNVLTNEEIAETLLQVIEVLEEVCKTPSTSKFTKSLRTSIQLTATKPLKTLIQVLKKQERIEVN